MDSIYLDIENGQNHYLFMQQEIEDCAFQDWWKQESRETDERCYDRWEQIDGLNVY